jgi:hypothetical protein
VRRHAARLLFSRCAPIIVASTGRAGSTMLVEAVSAGLVSRHFPRLSRTPLRRMLIRFSYGFCARLDHCAMDDPPIRKTHDLPTALPGGARVIFVYCDPLEAALSVARMTDTAGHAWFRQHQHHLRADGSVEDLFRLDVLGYEKQMQAWTRLEHDHLLCLAFDELWERQQEIAELVGFPIALPPRRPRAAVTAPATLDIQLFERLRQARPVN